jgi:hypothetical protein
MSVGHGYLTDLKDGMAGTVSTAWKPVKSLELYELSLGNFEPWPIGSRPTTTVQWLGVRQMMTFQILGMIFTALFMGALVTGHPGATGRY